MKDVEQDYEDFISTVSHELRTPLTSIRGFSQTMLASWEKLDDESKKKFIKIIEEQSNRLIHLVENMLAVTKIKSSKTNLVYSEFSANVLIEKVIMMIKAQYKTQKFEFKKGEIPDIFADKDKFQQILFNLIENSAKYSPENSTSEIETHIKENNIIIKISNNGIGINKSEYDKIFTKFSRIDNPLTRKVQGSGLGLYITKTLTQQMEGEISVDSVPISDELSKITFTLTMPVRTLEEQARIKCNQ